MLISSLHRFRPNPTIRVVGRVAIQLTLVVLGLLMRTNVASAQDSDVKAANIHYTKAMNLEQRGCYADALREYQDAYDTSPHYKVLHEIGNVEVQLGHYVEGIEVLQRYLREGGDRIPSVRRRRVEQLIASVKQNNAARLDVTTDREGALVVVDGVERGRTPLVILLNPGPHEVVIGHDGASSIREPITLGEGESYSLSPTLPPPSPPVGTLVFRCPGLERGLEVDDRTVLPAKAANGFTLSPGSHRVVFPNADGTSRVESYEVRADETNVVTCMAPKPPPPPPPTEDKKRPIAGYALMGAGLGLGAAATVAAVWTAGRAKDWRETKQAYDQTGDPELVGEAKQLDRATDYGERVAAGLATAGGALGLAGVVLVIRMTREEPTMHRHVRRGRPDIVLGERGSRFIIWSGRW